MVNKVLVFDLDDTLMDNVHDYAEPILRVISKIVQVLGNKAPHVAEIMILMQEIDSGNRNAINPVTKKPFAYSRDRFPQSQVDTYIELCKRANVLPDQDVVKEIRAIGYLAFDETRYAKNIHSLALPVMKFLEKQGDISLLCTKGDELVQEKKIKALRKHGITFAEVRIVEDLKTEAFREVSRNAKYKGHRLYAVNNAYKELAIAFEFGFHGVYIPVHTWEHKLETEIDNKRCRMFANLGEIATRYEEL